MFKFFTSGLRLLISMCWTRKKHFFKYLTTFYPFLRVFKYNRKFSFLQKRIFCQKKFFFQKSEFKGLLKSKSRKKNFKSFWSYIDFGKVLKKSEKSKYLSKYWVSWPKIRLDRKRIKSYIIKNKKKLVITPL